VTIHVIGLFIYVQWVKDKLSLYRPLAVMLKTPFFFPPECVYVVRMIHRINSCYFLTFVYPCIVSVTLNDYQQDATILAYFFIPNQFYMFRATARNM